MKVLITLIVYAVAVHTANLPPSITPCKQADPKYAECLVKAVSDSYKTFAAGDKNLGIPPIDPFFVEKLHIAGNGGSVDLEQKYLDTNIIGLSSGQIKKVEVKVNDKECTIQIEQFQPHLELIGQYEGTGKMLVFTLNGRGPYNITTEDLKMSHVLTCEKYEKKGKQHIKVTDYKLSLEPKKLYYDFENLVDGNKELSTEVLKVMNENNLEIFGELKKDYETTFSKLFTIVANQLFGKIPADVLFS